MFVFLFFFFKSIQRGGKWYKEMFKELHSSAGSEWNFLYSDECTVLDGVCEKLQVDHKHYKQFFLTSECILEVIQTISFICQCYWFRIHHKEAKLLTFERWLRAKTCMIELLCYGKTY